MGDVLQFVDRIADFLTVRLDLNDDVTWGAPYECDFSPPRLKTAWSSSLLVDGERQIAAAYENRRISLSLELKATTVDGVAAELQKLWRELDRPMNLLKWQPVGMTKAVYFRTLRSAETTVVDYPGAGTFRTVEVSVQAEPFAYGVKENLPSVTVSNDPAEPPDVTDGFSRTVANGWGSADTGEAWTTSGGSAADFSVASGVGRHSLGSVNVLRTSLLDAGISNVDFGADVLLSVGGGSGAPISVWLMARAADANNTYLAKVSVSTADVVSLAVEKRVAGVVSTVVSAVTAGPNVAGNRWRVTIRVVGSSITASAQNLTTGAAAVTVTATDSSLTTGTQIGIRAQLEAGNTNALPVTISYDNVAANDLSQVGRPTTAGRLCFDVTGVKGDVETPLVIKRPVAQVGAESLFAVRRRGTPANVPFLAQAEALTQGTNTTPQPNDAAFSGVGHNFSRCTFGTAAWSTRLSAEPYPGTAATDSRGTYRVFARVRKNGTSSTVQIRLKAEGVTLAASGGDIEKTVTGNLIQVIDLGLVNIPGTQDPVYDGVSRAEMVVRGPMIEFQATRSGGTDTLDVDYLLFVPADDRLAIVHWPTSISPGDRLVVDGVHDMTYAIFDITNEVMSGVPGYHVGGLPMLTPGQDNRVFFINETTPAAAEPSFPLTWTVDAWYWPRYLNVRPATT